MSTDEFNFKLCQERHDKLDKWCADMEQRMRTVSNRFIILLTGICLNLVGVIAILIKSI